MQALRECGPGEGLRGGGCGRAEAAWGWVDTVLSVPPTLLPRELAPSSEVTQDRLCFVSPGQRGGPVFSLEH